MNVLEKVKFHNSCICVSMHKSILVSEWMETVDSYLIIVSEMAKIPKETKQFIQFSYIYMHICNSLYTKLSSKDQIPYSSKSLIV